MGSKPDRKIAPLQMLEIMWQLDHAMQARSKRMQKTLGVTGPQRVVLRRLDIEGPTSANTIAVALHLHPSTLTGILQRLEAGGYVTRKRDERDSRRTLVSLSAEGRKLSRRAPGSLEQIISKVFSQSTDDEIACATRVLQRLCIALA